MSEATGRLLCERMAELALVVKGLTGVLVEDREADASEPQEAPSPITYMDGSSRG